MSRFRTILTVALVLVTMIGFTAALGGATGASFADTENPVSSEDASSQNANNNSGDDHSDGPPENNDNPDDPPCDADHGHPNESSEECDDDDPGNSGDRGNGSNGDDGDNDTDDGEQSPGDGDDNETDDGEQSPDNGNETNGTVGTCEEDGLVMNNTVANEAFGTENESGPISSSVHENEEQFQDLQPVVHEASCVVATVDNNAQQGAQSDGETVEQDGIEADSDVADVGV